MNMNSWGQLVPRPWGAETRVWHLVRPNHSKDRIQHQPLHLFGIWSWAHIPEYWVVHGGAQTACTPSGWEPAFLLLYKGFVCRGDPWWIHLSLVRRGHVATFKTDPELGSDVTLKTVQILGTWLMCPIPLTNIFIARERRRLWVKPTCLIWHGYWSGFRSKPCPSPSSLMRCKEVTSFSQHFCTVSLVEGQKHLQCDLWEMLAHGFVNVKILARKHLVFLLCSGVGEGKRGRPQCRPL